jgi:polyisoprenoid-binding protein YceI
MTTAVRPFTDTYRAQPTASTVAFAVRHSDVFWFRGSIADVDATLTQDGDSLTLEGSARVDSISIVDPPEMRASVLGASFFEADQHPALTFRSADLRLTEDGQLELEGDLTIRGTTHPVTATGHFAGPRQTSFGELAGLDLQATLDRRNFGLDWQAELPEGGNAVGWEVKVSIDLLLVKAADDAKS